MSIDTPMIIKGAYGVYLAFATAAWFCGLSLVLSRPYVRDLFSRNAYIFDRVMGLILILLAVNILYSEFGARFGI